MTWRNTDRVAADRPRDLAAGRVARPVVAVLQAVVAVMLRAEAAPLAVAVQQQAVAVVRRRAAAAAQRTVALAHRAMWVLVATAGLEGPEGATQQAADPVPVTQQAADPVPVTQQAADPVPVTQPAADPLQVRQPAADPLPVRQPLAGLAVRILAPHQAGVLAATHAKVVQPAAIAVDQIHAEAEPAMLGAKTVPMAPAIVEAHRPLCGTQVPRARLALAEARAM
jgi:hypothetical protein